jgi:M6 family metalloprotease-like protein
MKKICTFLLAIVIFTSFVTLTESSFAVPAKPGYISYSQPDGSLLTIAAMGDEFMHWAISVDGYTLLPNEWGGYEYAMLNNKGEMFISGVQANDPGNRSFKELNFLLSIKTGLFYTSGQLAELKEKCPIKPNYGQKMGGFPTTGTNKLLLILANFSNTSTTYTQAQFENYMNQANYGGIGSFRDFYLQNSYNLLTINTTVSVWVTVPNTHDYYGPQAKWPEFIRDAVNAADAAGVDFSQFDNDNDGDVDGVAVIHQGRGQEESNNPTDIWSHSWSLAAGGFPNFYKDGKLINDYTCQPEKNGPSAMTTIGVMCHEFGHNLGSPDFYDTDYGGSGGYYIGTGNWDVMANGSWNGGGARPAHHNAWTKAFFTWTTPVLITTTGTKTLRQADLYQDVYKFITQTSNEYYLLENRQNNAFDAGIPGHGMIIFHVDGNYISSHMYSNDINVGSHQGLYPVCASASGNPPGTYGAINSSGCPYPGSTSKTTFSDVTTPWAKSWAGQNSNTPISGIAENTQIITFNVDAIGGNAPVADFMVGGNTSIIQGEFVDFYDNSSNNPTEWAWKFYGGTPDTSNVKYPAGIIYNDPGSFDVKLTATNPYGSNTITKTGYITVNPNAINTFYLENFISIYPNPNTGICNINIFTPENGEIVLNIYNMIGMNVYNMTISKQTLNHTCTVDLSGLQSGLYYMTFRQKQNLATKRILIQK